MRRVERHFDSLIGAGVGDIVGALAFRAAERPDATACLLLERGERETDSLTYAALWRRASCIAAALKDLAPRSARVLIALPAGADFLAALFGCLGAGAIAVPTPPPRGVRGRARLAAIARDCDAALLLTTAALRDGVRALDLEVQAIEDLATAAPAALRSCDPEAIALLQYTSGSTGAPKGVVLPHRAIWHNQSVIRTCFDHAEGVTLVGWLPNFHDMGLIGNLLQPLYAGGLTVMMAPTDFMQKPLRWLRAISRYRAHTSGAPNFAYDLCLQAAADTDVSDLDLSCWRVAFNGAEPIRVRTLDAFAERFAACGFRREALMACYGLAESTLMVTGAPVDTAPSMMRASRARLADGALVAEEESVALVACGDAVAGTEVRIADPQTLAPLPDGAVGEVLVRSDSVCAGYWGAPTSPFAEGGRFLRTGGRLYIVGRLKDLLILNGRNVHPADIEAHLELTLAARGVLRVAATGIMGARSEELLLFAELSRERLRADSGDIVAAVRTAATEAAEAAPAGVVVLKPGALPLTSSGKLRRGVTRDRFLAGVLTGVAYRDAGAQRLVALAGDPQAR